MGVYMEIVDWLFNTPMGVGVLVFGGMLVFTLVAFISERKTHKMYFNHDELSEWDEFFADEDEEEDKKDK